MVKEEEEESDVPEEDPEEPPPRTKDEEMDWLVQQVSDSLLSMLSMRPESGLRDRVFAAIDVEESKQFNDIMEKKLRSIFRLKPKKKKRAVKTESETKKETGGSGERTANAGRAIRADSCLDNEFAPSDEDWESDEWEGEEEEDSFNESDNDSEPEKTQFSSTATISREMFGMRGGLSPLIGANSPPDPSSSSFSPFSPLTFPLLALAHNGRNTREGNEFDSTPPHSPHVVKTTRKEPCAASEEWSSDDTERPSRRTPAPSIVHPLTIRFDPSSQREATPPPWVTPSGRRILGEMPVPKDEFASDSDEEVNVRSQSSGNVQQENVSPHNPFGVTVYSTPITAITPPYSPEHGTQDENSPMSTVGETPPPHPPIAAPSVFTHLSIGTSPPLSLIEQAEGIFRRSGEVPDPFPTHSSPQDDPDFESDSD